MFLNLLHRRVSFFFLQGIINKRTNLCYVEGPIDLYDRYDRDKGIFEFGEINTDREVSSFNPYVLGRLMQMLVRDMPQKTEISGDSIELSKYTSVTFDGIP